MNRPTLSVCIPNYNHGHYIGETLEAILSQSLPPTEVIVVDDASTDDSVEVIRSFAEKHPAVRLIRNETNRGALYSVNLALSESTGEFVYETASDDKPLPGFFEKSIGMLREHPQARTCLVAVRFIDKDSNVLPRKDLHSYHTHEEHARISAPAFLTPTDVLKRLRRQPWFLGGATEMMFRREGLVEAGGMIPDHGPMADWFAPHFLAFKYGMCYIPEPLVAFRIMPNSFGSSLAARPNVSLEYSRRILGLMEEAEYKPYFPLWFRERKRREFTYAAFRHALVPWYGRFLSDLAELAPPSNFLSRLLLWASKGLMIFQWVLVKLYCYRSIASIFREEREGGQ